MQGTRQIPHLHPTSWVALVLLLGVAVCGAGAAEFVWLEGEAASSCSVAPVISAWGRVDFFSAGKWLEVKCEAEKVEQDFPDAGALIAYRFTTTQRGMYEIWNRIGYEFVRSPFDWRLDSGEWTRVSPDELTTDLMEFSLWNELAWLQLGERQMGAGEHTLEYRLPKLKDDKGKFLRILHACDAICIQAGPFHPNGRFQPGETYRDAQDEAASRQVFELPEAVAPGARTAVALAGLWEVCRHDEQHPGEVATPIQDFPVAPHWRAIPVPGDKNTLRPDLEMAHRLWYRTRVDVPAAFAGRSFQLVFPQNNLNTTVYVNGVLCGFDKNPFARVQIDVTKGVKAGSVNEIWVGLRDAWYAYSTNPDDPGKLRRRFNLPRKYSGEGFQDLAYPIWNHFESGILQTPELIASGAVYAADVFCQPSVARQELALEVTLVNVTAGALVGELRWEAIDATTGAIAKAFAARSFTVAAAASELLRVREAWTDPKLWWPDEPNLYRLRTTLVVDGRSLDVRETAFGFREWSWAGRDFRLNGVVWHGWADCHTAANRDDWLSFYRQSNQTVMRFWGTTWQGMPPEEALSFLDQHGVVCRRSGILDGEAIGYFAIENDPVLRERYGSEIKMQLMENWRDQILAQVRGERNHPSVLIWSLENEWLYINCINLYGGLMDEFERVVTAVAEAVQAVDPTRPTMVDGGGATQAQTLPVHGDHYVAGAPQDYPDLAYQANPTGGGRGRWTWDEKRPRFLGEDFYMTGNHPEVACFEGDSAFAGKPRRGVAIWERMLQEGYRWAGYGAWQFWLGQHDTDQSQYVAFAPRAVFCRQWDWTFGSGQQVGREFGIFNDTRYDDPIVFAWSLALAGRPVTSGSHELSVPPGTSVRFEETIAMPEVSARQEGELVLTLAVLGKEVFRDVKAVSVLKPTAPAGLAGLAPADLVVFDPQGSVGAFLSDNGIAATPIASLDALPAEGRVLVVGREALTPAESASSRLAAYAAAGGRRVIVLEQSSPLRYQGLPADLETAVNEGRTAFGEDLEHPVLQGLQQKDFFTWGKDRLVYRNAYLKPGRGATSLVQCDGPLRCTALAEVPVGSGALLLCQLTVGEQLGQRAVARQLLLNLLAYAASYRREYQSVVAAVNDQPQLVKTLDAIGLQYRSLDADIPLGVLSGEEKIAIISASPANLRALAEHLDQVNHYLAGGGSLVLCGLTPEGLADYNAVVGAEHMIRPGKRERVVFPAVRDRLTAGLTTADIALMSSERIFSWTAGNYVVADLFSYVIDYDEVASFGTSPFPAYSNITNGFVSADGWPLIINFPANPDGSPYTVPITLPQPQTLTEFTWVGNVFYWPQTRVELIFDGDLEHPVSYTVEPNAEPQTFAIEPPRAATAVSLRIAEWTPLPDTAPNIGIDNIYLKAQRSPAFRQTIKPMLNVGGLMHTSRGPGHIVLCNLLFKESEDVPENVGKKRTILATILRNLKAPFTSGKTVVAGADLRCQPVDISKAANQFRDERGWFGDPSYVFKDIPAGRHTLAGVPYQLFEFATSPVPTAIMLGGDGIPNHLPSEVKGIPLHLKADALFFLHTARIDQRRSEQEVREGKRYEMARYVVAYVDGETAVIPVCAEIDIESYRQKAPAVAIPGAQLAWSKPYAGTDQCAAAYSLQWNNPRADVEILTLDLVYGPDRRGVPALLALTAAVVGP